ncbi:hypothetical protein M408DRAFT_64286 [Serendipita vermifera MAFF 305830]|uniref:Ubiquitin-like domain-containing protein n=1 Tax=Serendipita vermifera MAFF 305830 TaxID=933852 RepID=A0A0C3B426_SERVB|nr:hypothetical protein M408DRAFT_64286 [Serendipita vermifera MAFF 305830]
MHLFSIPREFDVRILVKLPIFGEEKAEIDPLIWPTFAEQIKTIWVTRLQRLDIRVINLKVVTVRGNEYSFSGRPTTTIKTLAIKLANAENERLGRSEEDQLDFTSYRFIFYNRRLRNEETFEDCNIVDGSIIDAQTLLTGGKPVIYLFSPTPLSAKVQLELVPQWSFSAIYPVKKFEETKNGGQAVTWDVIVKPGSLLIDKESQAEVSYLYWEAKSNPSPSTPATSRSASPIDSTPTRVEIFDPSAPNLTPSNSILLNVDQVPLYLDKALFALGLHTEARTSFITYWLPDMLKHNSIALRFIPQHAYEASAPLKVEPQPSLTVRVFMLWRGLLPCEIEEDGWSEAITRAEEMSVESWKDIVGIPDLLRPVTEGDGFRVLEWGGMEVK